MHGGARIERQSKLARRAHVIVATPGRLEDLVDRGAVRLDAVRVLVLDEADRMLDMGFRPVVDPIVGRTPRRRQTLLFSATLDGEVGRLASAYTHEPRHHEHKPTRGRRRDIDHHFVAVEHAAQLGIDSISHVAHFDAADDGESCVHRAGRTRRAGRSDRASRF